MSTDGKSQESNDDKTLEKSEEVEDDVKIALLQMFTSALQYFRCVAMVNDVKLQKEASLELLYGFRDSFRESIFTLTGDSQAFICDTTTEEESSSE